MKHCLKMLTRWTALVLALSVAGCAAKPSKAEVDKKVKEVLSAASGEWKGISYDTKADDTVSVVIASRTVNGKAYTYSFTGGGGTGGVGVRSPEGAWLVKYRYEKDKEVDSSKMDGTEDDIKTFRATAAELAAAAIKACP